MAKALVEGPSAAAIAKAGRAGVGKIRIDRTLPGMQHMKYSELRSWCEQVARGLAMWTSGEEFARVMQTFTELGREGQRHGVPGRELLHALDVVLSVCETETPQNEVSPGVYVDSPPLRPLDNFHDFAKYYLIRGYEDGAR